MRQIYLNARKMITFVGKQDDGSSLAVRYMDGCLSQVRQRMADMLNLVRAELSFLMAHNPQLVSEDLVMESMRSLGVDGEDPFRGFNPKAMQKAIVSFLSRPFSPLPGNPGVCRFPRGDAYVR
jgi:hypothetical protein